MIDHLGLYSSVRRLRLPFHTYQARRDPSDLSVVGYLNKVPSGFRVIHQLVGDRIHNCTVRDGGDLPGAFARAGPQGRI